MTRRDVQSGPEGRQTTMDNHANAARIISQPSEPNWPRLLAVAKELSRPARTSLGRTAPPAEANVAGWPELHAMSLMDVCREAIQAMGAETHKL